MIYCPHCEKPLEGHDAGACRRKLSRRYFFGLLGGAVAALALPKRVPTGGLFNPFKDVPRLFQSSKLLTDGWPAMELWPTPKVGEVFTMAGVYRENPPDSRKTELIGFRIVDVVESDAMVMTMVLTKEEARRRYPPSMRSAR